jgi:predicted signal transduction protein with EAL and GGDEF domain
MLAMGVLMLLLLRTMIPLLLENRRQAMSLVKSQKKLKNKLLKMVSNLPSAVDEAEVVAVAVEAAAWEPPRVAGACRKGKENPKDQAKERERVKAENGGAKRMAIMTRIPGQNSSLCVPLPRLQPHRRCGTAKGNLTRRSRR